MATKPNIIQYDAVYGGLRPNSMNDYVLLREWILSLSAGGEVVDVTYAALVALVGSSGLVAGNSYQITDFRSRQTIPNTVDIMTGGLEPLIILATGVDTLSMFAYSPRNPTDEIWYNLNDINFGADRGRIIYRKQFTRNLSAFYDFRTFLYRRWDDGSGNFIVLTDNGNAFSDRLTFGLNCANISIDAYLVALFAPVQNNIIFSGVNSRIKIGKNSGEMTFLSVTSDVNIGDRCTDITFFSGGFNFQIGNQCSGIVIGANNGQLNFGDLNDTITTGDGCIDISIGRGNTDITIGDDCSAILIGDACETLDISSPSVYVTIGTGCFSINLNGQCDSLMMANDCGDITLTDSNQCSFGTGCSNMAISNAIGYEIGNKVTTGTISPINTRCRSRIVPFYIEKYIDLDFSIDSGAVGIKNLDLIPEGAIVVYMTLQAVGLVSGGLAEISLGIETDSPVGLLAPTPIATFTGDLEIGNALFVPPAIIPPAGVSGEQFLIMEITNAAITAGTFRLWYQIQWNNS